MSNIPSELHYLQSHEWVKLENDGTVTIGITDYAQESLGDVVFVELPESGAILSAGDEAGVVESVKAASDIHSPLTGEVLQTNDILQNAPEIANSDPYNDGWFFRMKLEDEGELGNLMDSDAYAEFIESEG